jgi:uncharacterized membrane protein YcjF (UPF0283 family)
VLAQSRLEGRHIGYFALSDVGYLPGGDGYIWAAVAAIIGAAVFTFLRLSSAKRRSLARIAITLTLSFIYFGILLQLLYSLFENKPPEFLTAIFVGGTVIYVWLASITFSWLRRRREEHAARIFSDAEKAEQAKNKPQASALYHRLLADFSKTDYVSKRMRSIIEERIAKSETLRKDESQR